MLFGSGNWDMSSWESQRAFSASSPASSERKIVLFRRDLWEIIFWRDGDAAGRREGACGRVDCEAKEGDVKGVSLEMWKTLWIFHECRSCVRRHSEILTRRQRASKSCVGVEKGRLRWRNPSYLLQFGMGSRRGELQVLVLWQRHL